MDTERLRADTRGEHEATEATVPLMSPDLTLEQYTDTLRRIYTVLHGWERWASRHAPTPEYLELLEQRQRSRLIREDLRSLHQQLTDADTSKVEQSLSDHLLDRLSADVASAASFLGAMYVVEGSTLGGQFIAKHVQMTFALAPGKGNSYFRGYGEETGSMWHSFKAKLAALPEEDTDEVIAAARTMFRVFGAAMGANESDTKAA